MRHTLTAAGWHLWYLRLSNSDDLLYIATQERDPIRAMRKAAAFVKHSDEYGISKSNLSRGPVPSYA